MKFLVAEVVAAVHSRRGRLTSSVASTARGITDSVEKQVDEAFRRK